MNLNQNPSDEGSVLLVCLFWLVILSVGGVAAFGLSFFMSYNLALAVVFIPIFILLD